MTEKEKGTNKIPSDIKEAVQKSLQEKRLTIEENPNAKAPAPDRRVVYSTETGQAPRGSATLTTEATVLPPPVKKVRKTTTKKHAPRVKAKAEPLHKEVKVDQRVLAAAKEIVEQGVYTTIEFIDNETVVVR